MIYTKFELKYKKFVSKYYIILMLIPIMIPMIILFLGGLISGLLQSFGYFPLAGLRNFTFSYYLKLITDKGFIHSLIFTLQVSVIPTVIGAIISTLLAFSMRKRFFGRKLLKFIYKLPLQIPYMVTIFMVIVLFLDSGLAARIFYHIGLISSPSEFPHLLYDNYGIGIMLVYLWKQIAFSFLVIYSVMLGISPEYEEAAKVFGSSNWQLLRYVYIPLMMPGIINASLLVFTFNFASFATPFILGKTYPNTLPVIAYLSYRNAEISQRPYAMAMSTIIALISALILFLYIKIGQKIRYMPTEGEK